jgi:murein DD-endopeptidase MepM/ murein hydrolase activator NlpD
MEPRVNERGELIVRVATLKNLFMVIAVLAATMVFFGSPARFSAPAEDSMGGLGAAIAQDTKTDVSSDDDRGLYYSVYQVSSGDTVGVIADKFDITIDSVVSFNNIQNTRALHPGQLLKIPNMAGVLYTAKSGDTVDSVADGFGISPKGIIEANNLMKTDLSAGKIVFLPDARLPSMRLREINGDLFMWPVRGYISSRFGWRDDPFTGARTYHTGLDIAIGFGTPIVAAMEGRVAETGYSSSFGNYILISHHSGWQSFYGHLSAIRVKEGQWVNIGERIGNVGNSGYSTGPHLHFTVYKSGRLMNPAVVLH